MIFLAQAAITSATTAQAGGGGLSEIMAPLVALLVAAVVERLRAFAKARGKQKELEAVITGVERATLRLDPSVARAIKMAIRSESQKREISEDLHEEVKRTTMRGAFTEEDLDG